MLELEVMPERSLGCDQWEFILGMHFSQAVTILQSQVGVIRGIQVLYSDSNPLSKDLELNLTQDGIRLKFDPITQRLKIIEIYNLKLVRLKYCGLIFNSDDVFPSMEQIEHSFGATLPGLYSPSTDDYILYFRGVSFYFPVTKCQVEWEHSRASNVPTTSPPCAYLVTIYRGTTESSLELSPMPLKQYGREVYLEGASFLHNHSLTLQLYTEGISRWSEAKRESIKRTISLGDKAQVIATMLGAPNRIFFKSEDKMRIHSPSLDRHTAIRRSDYFFNYFTLGLDILFDAKCHKAKKFILHTNYPGHYNFNIYHRCEFLLNLPVDNCDDLDANTIQVTAYTKWDRISERLKVSPKPVVLNRASSINTKNLFGATLCYGYRDFIFEIMPNQHIASLTIYKGDYVY
ncbi:hypothetical protein O3M35_005849 [Rhynocoris fuscipes]|uniref:Uncharacterized protein n=1 Tax=Rhynocoris fuscipes TaxID=488301 RepID=A0AAW1DRY2_9HEMI